MIQKSFNTNLGYANQAVAAPVHLNKYQKSVRASGSSENAASTLLQALVVDDSLLEGAAEVASAIYLCRFIAVKGIHAASA